MVKAPALILTLVSPLPRFLDEESPQVPLAPRLASLEGKTIGLLPNWRPSALHILEAVGALLHERCHIGGLVTEQPVRELPQRTSGLIDTMAERLEGLSTRVDAVITATGD